MKKTVVIAVEYEDEVGNHLDPNLQARHAGRGAYYLLGSLAGVTKVTLLNAQWFKEAMVEARKEMLKAIDDMIEDLENLEKPDAPT